MFEELLSLYPSGNIKKLQLLYKLQIPIIIIVLSQFSYGFLFLSDSTSEYMSNSPGEEIDGIVISGLPCATVLIGVFHRESGLPVAGVINQPFSSLRQDSSSSNQWSGRRLWGVTYAEHCCYFLGVDLVLQIKIMKDRLEQSKQTFADFFPSAFSSYC